VRDFQRAMSVVRSAVDSQIEAWSFTRTSCHRWTR
jgi:hypothetical protein